MQTLVPVHKVDTAWWRLKQLTVLGLVHGTFTSAKCGIECPFHQHILLLCLMLLSRHHLSWIGAYSCIVMEEDVPTRLGSNSACFHKQDMMPFLDG